jgi:hypothetical protein
LRGAGWQVAGTGRGGTIDFADDDGVRRELAAATHVLSSVPPVDGDDPVLERYIGQGAAPPASQWLGYLSSTGVYGNAGGAWVDESAPTGTGRRTARAAAGAAWLAIGARVFRLPGMSTISSPG